MSREESGIGMVEPLDLPPMFPGGLRIGAPEIEQAVEVLNSKRLFRYYGPSEGPSKAAEFELRMAEKMGAQHALAVSSGTAALACGFAALGVGRGDEVVVPAYTWISTAAAVTAVGAVPVIANVDDALTLDAASLSESITAKTRAIAAVHMRGGPANIERICEVAHAHGIPVLEDSAQSVGASYRGKRLGTFGDVGIYSHQFNKIITAGEGGTLVTDRLDVYERATMFHDVAASMRASEMHVDRSFVAFTLRMPELLAAVMLAQLDRLDVLLADMRGNFGRLKEATHDAFAARDFTDRHQWDPLGDACVALIKYAPTPAIAKAVVDALRKRGVPAARLYVRDETDYHVAAHWRPLIAQWSWSDRTVWSDGDHGSLDLASCRRSFDLLERAIQIDVSPDYSPSQIGQISQVVNDVLHEM